MLTSDVFAPPVNEMYEPSDPPLTDAERALAGSLTAEAVLAIDEALLRNASAQWRKVARIVGTTMSTLSDRVHGIPDVYFAARVRDLVGRGLLESQGDLTRMRYSEVRLPGPKAAQ
jgi:hypothetical protein